jgi:hypothetical protein
MQSTALADILVPFAEAASINPRDAANTLKKRIIMSLGFTDTRRLHDGLFKGAPIDWDAVLPYVQSVSLTVADWCELVALLHFIREPVRPKHVAELINSAMAGLKVSVQGKSLTPIESMQVSFARAGMVPTWDILAKSLLLCNLVDVDHAAALTCFLNSSAAQPAAIASLISNIGAHRHTPDEYTAVFYAILSNDGCHVSAHHIMKSLKQRDEAIERVRQSARTMLRSSQKPSLTDLVERRAALKTKNNDGFAGFCNAARLQSNASVRRACYYVMSLPGTDNAATTHADALRHIVGDDPVVLDALGPIGCVTTPEVAILCLFLEDVKHIGVAPRCLRSFRDAIAGAAGMHWTTVLRLYLAAYSRAPCELWAHALDMSSSNVAPETEKMIRGYAAENPISLDQLLPALTGADEDTI